MPGAGGGEPARAASEAAQAEAGRGSRRSGVPSPSNPGRPRIASELLVLVGNPGRDGATVLVLVDAGLVGDEEHAAGIEDELAEKFRCGSAEKEEVAVGEVRAVAGLAKAGAEAEGDEAGGRAKVIRVSADGSSGLSRRGERERMEARGAGGVRRGREGRPPGGGALTGPRKSGAAGGSGAADACSGVPSLGTSGPREPDQPRKWAFTHLCLPPHWEHTW